ncbi:MAG: MATE family efflux transporter [Aequoribacter sp.]|jgi:putative MATE family efflux protein|uniref:MATE family efflux transporter n=1 Tax=Aequoribacter sp. TaxID=2847771 RepID=UPI003C647FAA
MVTHNAYLVGSTRQVFIKTALPIIFMMLVNGSFNLIDAYFLGVFVGAEALAAVTATFPATLFFVALSTLVANGFASIMARALGAKDYIHARETYAQALSLSILVSGVLIGFFLHYGKTLTLAINQGQIELAALSHDYLLIMAYATPISFALAVNGDSLRCEGNIRFMTTLSLVVVCLNAVLNYVFIVKLKWGVSGSAYGTVCAQIIGLLALGYFRLQQRTALNLPFIKFSSRVNLWIRFISLGAPSSLRYIGLALASGAILYNLQSLPPDQYEVTVSAYGIINRVMTFVFLPLLGLSLAFQSIVGNTYGAKQYDRTNDAIKTALWVSLLYGCAVQGLILHLSASIGSWFVNAPEVITRVDHILPIWTAALSLMGPLMVVGMLFQSIGDAKRAAVMSIVKTYCFSIPLIFLLSQYLGVKTIWYSAPIAEVLALMVALIVLYQRSTISSFKYGLFFRTPQSTQPS